MPSTDEDVAMSYVQSSLHQKGIRNHADQHRAAVARMTSAESRSTWEDAARELDLLENNLAWKNDDFSPIVCASEEKEYEPQLIADRLLALDRAILANDIGGLLRILRSCYSRDLGGVGNSNLYRHCHIGTKRLIERYVESSLDAIDVILHHATREPDKVLPISNTQEQQWALSGGTTTLPARKILAEILCARQTFGRSALLLSGGGTFGMAHIGIVK